ncbi:hypothetical protein [Sodaliphilus sp.]|uniref:hypothetical protein n=1 Tax=Sodaliphilus sp. TaxID=2815818 RepID=UPI00388DFB9B
MSSEDNNTGQAINAMATGRLATAALDAYLANYEPDDDNRSLRTTDAILRDLDDMVELNPNDIAEVMLDRGFRLVFLSNGRHGWAMRQG